MKANIFKPLRAMWSIHDSVVVAILLFTGCVLRGEPAVSRHKTPNPIAELQAQDQAVSLMRVAYGELQTYLIETDYSTRLTAAAALKDPRRQAEVKRLAVMERDLRLKQLATNLANLDTVYSHARGEDERRTGVSVPFRPDEAAASRKFHDMVVIAPTSNGETQVIPVDAVLGKQSAPVANETGPYVEILRQAADAVPGLADAVATLLQSSAAARRALRHDPTTPVAVSYRLEQGRVKDLVAQVFSETAGPSLGLLNQDNPLTQVFGADFVTRVDQLLGRLTAPSIGVGQPVDVQRRQHTWQTLCAGDLGALAALTAAPLHVMLLVPAAPTLMPASLRDRVRAVAVHAEFTQSQWQGAVTLATTDAVAAEQVAQVLAGWRMLFEALPTSRSASGARTLAQTISQQLTLEARGNSVRIASALPKDIALKVGERAATKVRNNLNPLAKNVEAANRLARN